MAGAIYILLWVRRCEIRFDRIPDTRDLWRRMEREGGHYTADRPGSVLVVGFLQRGREQFGAFGQVRKGEDVPAGQDSIFEIGSLTTSFTALAFAELASRKVLHLHQPVASLLPAHLVTPHNRARTMALRHLACHASGLPEFPRNLEEHVADETNPYADYTREHLLEAFAAERNRPPPGRHYQYSSYGYGLLGCLLEHATRLDYPTILQEVVCRTLGLQDTVVAIDPERAPRMLQGWHPGRRPASSWSFDGLRAAGGVRSTARDLLTLLRAELRPESTPLQQALKVTQAIHFHRRHRLEGLGWHIMKTPEGPLLHWQNGATGGFVGFVGFDLQNRNGLVLLSNHGDAWNRDDALDQLGLIFLKLAARISMD